MVKIGYESTGEILERTKDYLFDRHIPGSIDTGFKDLDYITGGFNKGELISISGRPAMGKTGFVLSMLEHICIKQGKTCLYFALYDSIIQVVRRLIGTFSGCNNLLNCDQPDNIAEVSSAICDLKKAPLYISGARGLSIEEITGICKKLQNEKDIDLIIIDDYQSLCSSKILEDRSDYTQYIIRGLRDLAERMSCPLVVLSHLSRSVEHRKDHMPRLSDVNKRGDIERFSDKVIFIYRDEYYNENSNRKDTADIIVAYNNSGNAGVATLKYTNGRFIA